MPRFRPRGGKKIVVSQIAEGPVMQVFVKRGGGMGGEFVDVVRRAPTEGIDGNVTVDVQRKVRMPFEHGKHQ
ncbi:MAG: hypothetical protein M1321_00590 [Candidatus Marsarchaeota archaeon]|nr:hypothetical protein [Candidatus Marsarchaeota archaeon]